MHVAVCKSVINYTHTRNIHAHSWYKIEHWQCKLFAMTAMSARHIFVVVYGRKTPPVQVVDGQDLIRNVLVCKLHLFCLYMYLQPLQL